MAITKKEWLRQLGRPEGVPCIGLCGTILSRDFVRLTANAVCPECKPDEDRRMLEGSARLQGLLAAAVAQKDGP